MRVSSYRGTPVMTETVSRIELQGDGLVLLVQMIVSTLIAMFAAAISLYHGNGLLLSLLVYSLTGSFALVSLATIHAYAFSDRS